MHVFWDIVLRDFGLLFVVFALVWLVAVYALNPFRRSTAHPVIGQDHANPAHNARQHAA